ncbi:enoyl-CoA hydratase-related protein [Achromobacter insolitus]|uniref:1,2-epoxyphenylacetyl-CoA isomerase n=1 Tax=Achromobacter insolitus TaxID=217204 RepID=A0A6S7EVS5_9BURK|nr:enoyl-CoA hydratase-related protein [Achromobacter insolitus]CAB3929452.1 1,2-epoxyphenylacetyl-CoA isomerase [Achromobacter insolitus]CAB3935791.1 1,2-epoxyphenylacetyl-CoA isomerase [Achromobacter insolitus]
MAPQFENIAYSNLDGIARITINRPEKLNSLDGNTMAELRKAVELVEDDEHSRVLVLTGTGRAFCAGQDLADPAMNSRDGDLPDIGTIVERHFKPLVLRLKSLHVPTIAAVNGVAAGGGAAIALSCDLVVAARSAYFLQAFSKIGLTPDTGSTWYLPRFLGLPRALGLALLADRLPATQAAEWGLIWQAVDDQEFIHAIDTLAVRLANLPTTALVRTRQLMLTSTVSTLEQQLSLEATIIREMGWRRDYQEGLEAFQQKRQPRFTGE